MWVDCIGENMVDLKVEKCLSESLELFLIT
jgi:hypothetical protein